MYWEIQELGSGKIALKQHNDDGEPLMTLEFSAEAMEKLKGNHLEVAKIMISAGLQYATELLGEEAEFDEEDEDKVVH
jgi:hypothetical protein